MNKNVILVFLSALLCFFISSCKKDQLLLPSRSQVELVPDVTIEDGYLKFKNDRVFDSLSTLLMKRPGSEITDFVDGVEEFKSYGAVFLNLDREYESVNSDKSFAEFQNKYKNLVNISGDSSLTYRFGTPLSSKFINLRGEVRVGEYMIVYTKDNRIISYKGVRKTEEELLKIQKSDSLSNVYVQRISNKSQAKNISMASGDEIITSLIKSELYYNGDKKRRLFVECWVEDYRVGGFNTSTKIYITSKQELKKTFGGWRTNETNYSFRDVNFNLGIFRIPEERPKSFKYTLANYSVNNVYGPILIDMGTYLGSGVGVQGFGNFTSGGVPNTPRFEVNWSTWSPG
ncbi:hypothetical protein [Pedobacter antarcticus]|uniref:hypothetical protein n=1 Tax=Pedobacter antarcticus TaxID=34086 RepID=UPI0008880DA3|nr:hypothetical protein [Pedobacter antarcticus]SDM53918.1 hypothetical protein SAMN04488084_10828 [Pedobacter antarcticus]